MHACPQIVNISSGLGSIQSLKSGLQAEPLPAILTRALAYKSSKAALNMRTRLQPLSCDGGWGLQEACMSENDPNQACHVL
jgi:NAD(P)-dependent dehydrogenase (short-subunit alcohol dehydrogenase family)